ncbi:MAG: Coenzyme F420 hydrogenase/dehydrogenase, beta subunit C-terminal domain [Bacteroidaceae bacterium]|nr:Coenzyme F420 hydrogenase/dehydrogenase, beta subunit C-terminal domain [Bacteroidaceae bacterium]
MTLNNNITNIGNSCTKCGACKTFCPQKCISYTYSENIGHYTVSVDVEKCTQCGLCLKICPVSKKAEGCVYETFLRDNKVAFAAYSKNENVRKAAASGGFITTFLCFLMQEGIIDGALVSRRKGICGEAFIARSCEEIISAKTSIYAPVDYTNGLEALRNCDCKNIAVVGLPCHIQAINNIRKINKKIDNKIYTTISIVCGKTPSAKAYKYVAQKNNINYNNITNISNRGGGWPGYMTIEYEGGKFKTPYRSKMSMGMVLSSPLLCSSGCNSCIDGYGVGSDISVCDAWLSKYTSSESSGWNLVLAQTELARALLNKEKITEYLHIEEESLENFYKANRRVIDKYLLNNTFLPEEYRLKFNKTPSIKQKIYSFTLNMLTNLIESLKTDNIGIVLLYLGKILNKLKD